MRKWNWKGNGGGPKITLAEFASTKGISTYSMINHMRHSNNYPMPCSSGGRKTYYEPKELNEWWDKIEGKP